MSRPLPGRDEAAARVHAYISEFDRDQARDDLPPDELIDHIEGAELLVDDLRVLVEIARRP